MIRVSGAAIRVEGLGHTYPSRAGGVTVLDGLDLMVEGGSQVALTGASGSGKSTLLCVLGALEAPQRGRVEVGGQDLAGLSGDELADFRRHTVGFVFQHFGLLEALTASENVELACTLAGAPPATRRARAAELLEAVDLADRAAHRPVELSGGERQRVAIARALANRPRLVLADEPTGNLDETTGSAIVDLIFDLPARRGATLALVTHDAALAARCDRVIRMRSGRVEKIPAAVSV
jgi:putative ABC transport system ATP-binding protein